jgi:hypothetical protein
MGIAGHAAAPRCFAPLPRRTNYEYYIIIIAQSKTTRTPRENGSIFFPGGGWPGDAVSGP